MLLNLVTLADSGRVSFKLEVSRTYYDPYFVPRKNVKVDGFEVCVVDFQDLTEAAVDWPCLRHEGLERYMPPLRVIMPKFDTAEG